MQIAAIEQVKGLPARREPEPADERALRQALREAIETSRAADARAALATAAESRAVGALAAAQAEAARLEAQQKRTSDAAVEKASKVAADALRASSPIPIATTLPDFMITASLASARAQKAILELALAELNAETNAAKSEVARAAAEVAARADAVVEFEARRLAAKRATLEEMIWEVDDALHGLFRLDRQRKDGPRLEAIEYQLSKQLDRRGLAIAKDKRLIEQPGYVDHLDRLQAAQEGRWAAHRLRLMADASAQFQAPGGPVEQ